MKDCRKQQAQLSLSFHGNIIKRGCVKNIISVGFWDQ